MPYIVIRPNNCGGGISLLLNLRNVEAIYTDDTTSYVKVGELYDDASGGMNLANVNNLIKFITGNADLDTTNAEALLDYLAENTTTSADIRANTVTVNGITKSSEQDVIVTLGGLDWEVVYLSKDNNDNNILTLWLSSSYQSAWEGRASDEGTLYGFVNGSLYSDWSRDWDSKSTSGYPSNMYGTSYIRVVTLNNGGTYATSAGLTTTAEQSLDSAFARFTMEEAKGSLTSYLVTPSVMSWQLLQSAVDEGIERYYLCPNESINDPTGILGGKYFSSFNYHSKTGYGAWANDYLWLPSCTETGYDTSYLGIWETSTTQRQNISSSDDPITPGVGSNNSRYGAYVRNYSWLRSGSSSAANGVYSLYMSSDGFNFYPNFSHAVRPALHFNLNTVIENVAGPGVYEVTLDNNGGTGEEISLFVYYGNGIYSDDTLSQSINSISGLVSSLPTMVGHDFQGYYTSATSTTALCLIDENGNFTDLFTNTFFSASTTLYARWEPSTYTITLNANGGGGGLGAMYVKYETGIYSNSTTTASLSSLSDSNLPTRAGFTLLGFYTENNTSSICLISVATDSTGERTGTFSELLTTTYFTDHATLYAQWEANYPAYYDADGDYWYVENGRMPQSRVSSSLNRTLDSRWASLSDGATYSMGAFGGLVLTTKVYQNEEYYYNETLDDYYLVEPIKWRLTSNAGQTSGYGTDEDTYAIMDTIVYYGQYSTGAINGGDGYQITPVYYLKDNYIDSTFLVRETLSMPTFGGSGSLNSTSQTFTDNIFVSSREDILAVADTYSVKFSDLVTDLLADAGSVPLYFTRDLGTNLNHVYCLTPDGALLQYQPNRNKLGVQFTIKITEYACVER